jgi:hypothetical protein
MRGDAGGAMQSDAGGFMLAIGKPHSKGAGHSEFTMMAAWVNLLREHFVRTGPLNLSITHKCGCGHDCACLDVG